MTLREIPREGPIVRGLSLPSLFSFKVLRDHTTNQKIPREGVCLPTPVGPIVFTLFQLLSRNRFGLYQNVQRGAVFLKSWKFIILWMESGQKPMGSNRIYWCFNSWTGNVFDTLKLYLDERPFWNLKNVLMCRGMDEWIGWIDANHKGPLFFLFSKSVLNSILIYIPIYLWTGFSWV